MRATPTVRPLKLLPITLIAALWLTAVPLTRAWLGENPQALSERYSTPKTIEKTTGDIPQKFGEYVELREIGTTNSIWMAPPRDGHYIELIEKRDRYSYFKDGMVVTVYIGSTNETYGSVDFSGKSAREVIDGLVVWQKNSHGDKVGHPTPLPQKTIDTILEGNKGNSTWSSEWQSVSTPGRFVKWTADKTRQAIIFGASPQEVYRLEVKMVDETGNAN